MNESESCLQKCLSRALNEDAMRVNFLSSFEEEKLVEWGLQLPLNKTILSNWSPNVAFLTALV